MVKQTFGHNNNQLQNLSEPEETSFLFISHIKHKFYKSRVSLHTKRICKFFLKPNIWPYMYTMQIICKTYEHIGRQTYVHCITYLCIYTYVFTYKLHTYVRAYICIYIQFTYIYIYYICMCIHMCIHKMYTNAYTNV